MKISEEMTLDELAERAHRANLLESWKRDDYGSLVFELASATVHVSEEEGKAFVRGLLRGYETAARLDDEAEGLK